jgi:hypothetical protein
MVRFRPVTIFYLSILPSLGMIILFTLLVQASYADNTTVVNVSKENKVLSFTITNGNPSPSIYGFVITIHGHGHYSKITESPDGWSGGIIKHQSVIWTTKSHPVQPGSSEGNFALEVTQTGKYTVSWSATDHTWQPIAWGTVTITVT